MNTHEDFDRLDEIDLRLIFKISWSKRIPIICITFLFSFLSLVFALFLPNIYKSETILIPSKQTESFSSELGGISSLASFAGLDIPDFVGDKTTEAIERIKSFEFFSIHFLPYIELQDLMAVQKWKVEENKIFYDENIYDSQSNMWVRDAEFPKKSVPSNQEAFEIYKEILSINRDEKTSFVKISIEHQSPFIAKEWIEIILKNINESMSEIDRKSAQNAIDFLKMKYTETNIQSLRIGISKLLESQMQTLMLSSSENDYIFKILDSPVVPEEKFSPNRFIILFVGTIFGFVFSFLIVFAQYYIFQNKNLSLKKMSTRD